MNNRFEKGQIETIKQRKETGKFQTQVGYTVCVGYTVYVSTNGWVYMMRCLEWAKTLLQFQLCYVTLSCGDYIHCCSKSKLNVMSYLFGLDVPTGDRTVSSGYLFPESRGNTDAVILLGIFLYDWMRMLNMPGNLLHN